MVKNLHKTTDFTSLIKNFTAFSLATIYWELNFLRKINSKQLNILLELKPLIRNYLDCKPHAFS